MDPWDFLSGDDATTPFEAAAAARARWPAEIAALHVIVPGAALFVWPTETDESVVRFFADEDPGVVRQTGDAEEDLWALFEGRHDAPLPADG